MQEGLFCDGDNKWYTKNDIYCALQGIGAQDCDVLFIHTDIMFGMPNRGIRRNEFLSTLYDVIKELNVQTLIYPTFTYSFCNNEPFDVLKSKTSMGALNEFARKQPSAIRSRDPLLSVASIGAHSNMFDNLKNDNSLGCGCALDILHHTPDVKFLFFGAEFSNCFTYVHYVEKMLSVPYRFDMTFDGTIIDENGESYRKKQSINTACYGIRPIDFYHFKEYLIAKGYLLVKRIGDKEISIISEPVAYREICNKIGERIDYFLERPFTSADLAPIYTYDRSHGRITHC